MAKKAAARATDTKASSEPKFPYVNNTNSLRQFLRDVPQKPKPPKLTIGVLEGWGYTSTNDRPIIATLKKLGFLDGSGVPTSTYESFMHPGTGPQVMASAVREVYSPLFGASHAPYKEDAEHLKRLFNIHSGGSERTLAYQIQTFKALCEFADFNTTASAVPTVDGSAVTSTVAMSVGAQPASTQPSVRIDLHIHLPENKSARDYEAIIQDIARYIYRLEPTDAD